MAGRAGAGREGAKKLPTHGPQSCQMRKKTIFEFVPGNVLLTKISKKERLFDLKH